MLTLKEIKDKIENNCLDDTLLIIECPDNYFTADQYINRIAKNKRLTINYVDSMPQVSQPACLYVYTIEELKDNIIPINNCIIRCKKCINSTLNNYVITIPKLENWQIENYAKCKLDGLTDSDIKLLCAACNYNIYVIQAEIDKLTNFDNNQQSYLFKLGQSAGLYAEKVSIFDLTNALMRKDQVSVMKALKLLNTNNVSGYSLLNVLIKNFKYVIAIQLGLNINYKDIGLTDKQYYAIKRNNVGIYTKDQLVKIFKFLTSVDYQLKAGLIRSDELSNYIVLNILEA